MLSLRIMIKASISLFLLGALIGYLEAKYKDGTSSARLSQQDIRESTKHVTFTKTETGILFELETP